MLVKRIYAAGELVSGELGALDGYDGSGLNDGDMCITMVPGDAVYFHVLDALHAGDPSPPAVIAPFVNAEDKRWVLVISFSAGVHTHGSLSNDGTIGDVADLPLITGSGGFVGTGAFGTGSTDFAVGDHGHGVATPTGEGEQDGFMSHEDKSRLDAMEDEAQVNVQADWGEADSSADSFIQGKPTLFNPAVPGPLGEATPGTIRGYVKEIIKTEHGTLTAAEVAGTIINNFGQVNNVELRLPVAAAGMSCMVLCGTAVEKYFHVAANENDVIYLDGAPGEAGEYVGVASAEAGSYLTLITFQTGAAKWDWIATSGPGSWEAE